MPSPGQWGPTAPLRAGVCRGASLLGARVGPSDGPTESGCSAGLGPLLPPPMLVDLGLGKALSSWPLPLPLSPRGRLSVVKFGEMSPQVLETIRRMASENPAFSRWSWVRAAPRRPSASPWQSLDTPGSGPGTACQPQVLVLCTVFPLHFLLADSLPHAGAEAPTPPTGRKGGRELWEEGKERGRERGRGEPHHALDPVERLPGKLSSTRPQSWVFTWVPEALGPAGQGLPPTAHSLGRAQHLEVWQDVHLRSRRQASRSLGGKAGEAEFLGI